jgi:hypothetical protein
MFSEILRLALIVVGFYFVMRIISRFEDLLMDIREAARHVADNTRFVAESEARRQNRAA